MFFTKDQWDQALMERHGKELHQNLSQAVIAICGLGGLGSNIALALARAGVGTLILIDFDRVDLTNLHRQQYKASQVGMFKAEALAENLKEIAPYLHTYGIVAKITAENCRHLLENADLICEAFDNAEAKSMLTDCVLETLPDKYLIAASGMAGLGSANTIKTKKITDHFYLCGDGVSEVKPQNGLFASRVMICAAHQAHMAIRILAGETEV